MSRRNAVALLPLLCLALFAASSAQAADEVLKLVPDSALGFAVVNRLGDADAKVQELGREMQLPVPSLLAKLAQEGGIREGLDEKGAAAMLALPPEEGSMRPALIVLFPVADFGKFLAQFKAEAAEGVAKIDLWGGPVWARNIGGFVALAEGTKEPTLVKSLKVSKEVPETLAPWSKWLAEKDAAVVITQPGIKFLSAKVQDGIRMMKAAMPQADEQAKSVAGVFDIYAKLFQAAEQQVASVGFGVRLDKQGALRVAKRVRLVAGGSWAQLAGEVQPTKEDLLANLPAGRFMFAGGGAIPEGIWDAMMRFSMDVMKSMPNLYGLSEAQINDMPKMSLEVMKRVRSMSMALGVGPGDASLYSRLAFVMRVDAADAFLAGYEESLGKYNEFIKKAQSPLLQPIEVQKIEIDGAAALEVTAQAPQLPAGLQSPQQAKIMEAFFSAGGKLVARVVPVGDTAVVISYASKDVLQETVRAIKQGKPGLAGDAEVSKTTALLPAGAPWIAVWSPQGTIDFVNRMIPVVVPEGVKATFKLPEFPITPPIGFAVTTAADEIEGYMVVPAEVLKQIGPYALKVMLQGRGGEKKATQQGPSVSGQVTIDGQPLSAVGTIRFEAAQKADSKSLPIKDGKFQGQLKPGQYRVLIRGASVPQKFRNSETSGLKVETKGGKDVLDFDLNSN